MLPSACSRLLTSSMRVPCPRLPSGCGQGRCLPWCQIAIELVSVLHDESLLPANIGDITLARHEEVGSVEQSNEQQA